MNKLIHHSKQKGLSLVELMVAMLLGSFLIGGTVSILVGTMQSTRLNQALVQLQSNSRFAGELISNDLRSAGFMGCPSRSTGNFIITATSPPTNKFDETAVYGAVVDAGDWTPGKPLGYNPPTGVGAPIEGTHALMTQYALAPGNRLSTSMPGKESAIELTGTNDELVKDSYAVIANCNNGELFSINNSVPSGDSLRVSPANSLSQPYSYNPQYPEAVRVMPFKSIMYYVGNTGRLDKNGDVISSLYMQTIPYDLASNPPLEIVENVEQLQLRLGVREAGNFVFHSPDSATLDFSDVGLVEVGLLLTSNGGYAESSVSRPYYLANNLITVAGGGSALTYPDDNKLRKALNISVKIRNRD